MAAEHLIFIEALRRFAAGLRPTRLPDEMSPTSLIAAHLADVIDEHAFEAVYAKVLGETETKTSH